MARQSWHVPGPQLMNSVTTVNLALAAAQVPERSAAGRARFSTARRLTRRSVSNSRSKTSGPAADRRPSQVQIPILTPLEPLRWLLELCAGLARRGAAQSEITREICLLPVRCLDIQIPPGYTTHQWRRIE
jgi:hypothetical protein